MKHGGKRPGAGRPPSAAGPSRNVTVRLPAAVEAELVSGLVDGERLSDVLRVGALALVRERRAAKLLT